MEMKRTGNWWCSVVRVFLCTCLFIVFAQLLFAQQPLKNYSVKDGKMYIKISRQIKESSLDSFINQFDLDDIGLKQLIKTNKADSLQMLGWKVELNDPLGF